MQVREFLEPVTILDDFATLADAAAALASGRRVLVQRDGALHGIAADAALGFPATRRLLDVPLTQIPAVAADDDITAVLGSLAKALFVPVQDHGAIIGCVDRAHVLEALATNTDPDAFGMLLAARMMPALLHDLANSLMVADGSLPADRIDAGEDLDEQLAAAHIALRHAGSLLGRARALVTGHDDEAPVATDVNAVLAQLMPLLRVCAGVSIEVTLELQSGLPAPRIRARSIERTILNLVLNARDAMGETGSIRISTSAIDADRIAVCVEDDGPGIATAMTAALFAAGATTKAGPARGLGLASAVSVLSRFGATIEPSPSALGGAGFRLVLPV